MAIKTTITDKQNTPISYPVLRKGTSGIVVLFTGPSTGVCLADPTEHTPVGTVYTTWTCAALSNVWSDCTITISNA